VLKFHRITADSSSQTFRLATFRRTAPGEIDRMGIHGLRQVILRALTVTTVVAAACTLSSAMGTSPAAAIGNDDWFGIINTYRAMSGVAPVSENQTWSSEAHAHSCYMLYNGIAHDEVPGNPGYTPGGDVAGNNGNVAVSSSVNATAKNHIDLWMTGPFHAIGVLRHGLRTTGFGLCANGDTSPWRSAATLDVLRGIDYSAARPSSPIVFPGRGATVAMGRFITESPNPMSMCGWSGEAGLPLIAMMPGGVGGANASLTGPGGPIETCVLHPGNTSGIGQGILASENAVIVMPRVVLTAGTYTATVTSTGGSITWSFSIDPAATLSLPAPDVPDTAPVSPTSKFEPVTPSRFADSRVGLRVVRLSANQPASVEVAGGDVTAVSANFTVDRPSGTGYLTVYNCTANVPVVSTLNYTGGAAVPNQAVVPLTNGKLCLFSPVDTDVIIDVNGYFRSSSSANGFVPMTPARLVDTRWTGATLQPGEVRAVRVANVAGGAPGSATAVALNVTAIAPRDFGFLSVFPCDRAGTDVSNVNFRPWENRPNSVLVPTAADGTICVVSTVATGLLVDISGYFATSGGLRFTSLNPVRLLDTRSYYAELNPATDGGRLSPGQVVRLPVAGTRGVPSNAKAVSVNLTAAEPATNGFVTAFPCGSMPEVSNLNTDPWTPAIANGAMVKLDAGGALCLYTDHTVHLIVDINGMWS
jgi:Cysteine-rich secretory protein family